MNAKRAWQVGGVIAFLAVLLAGWFLLVSPLFDQAARSDLDAASVDAQNAALRTQIGSLKEIDQSALGKQLADFELAIPQIPAMTAMTRDIKSVVESAGATLTSVTYTDPALFAAAGGGVGEDGTPASGAASSSTAVPLPILQTDLDAATRAGLIDIVVTVSLEADQTQFLAAADALQSLAQRQILVTGINYNPPSGSSAGSGTINALAWVLPGKPIESAK